MQTPRFQASKYGDKDNWHTRVILEVTELDGGQRRHPFLVVPDSCVIDVVEALNKVYEHGRRRVCACCVDNECECGGVKLRYPSSS